MSLKENIAKARELVLSSQRPYILFDDDPDGLASFLLLYRMVKAGKGTPLKGSPLDEEYAQKVNDYSPDLVIVLDKAVVNQDFFDKIRAPIIWIDHHDLQEPKGVLYVNPQKEGMNIPTSALCYQISQEDEWIAAVGIVADWQLPSKELQNKLQEQYPDLLPTTNISAPEALFTTPLGILARVFSFNLKGKSKDVLSSIKILTRIKNPYELLEQQHAQAKLVMKKYQQHLNEYQELLNMAKEQEEKESVIFTYEVSNTSFTPDLSNELLYLYPQKTIFIARESNGSYKCSIRDNNRNIKCILTKLIDEVGGDGGGHEHACGAIIPNHLFEEFVSLFKKQLQTN